MAAGGGVPHPLLNFHFHGLSGRLCVMVFGGGHVLHPSHGPVSGIVGSKRLLMMVVQVLFFFLIILVLPRSIADIGPDHLLEVLFHCRAARGRHDLGRNHLVRCTVAACLKISRFL